MDLGVTENWLASGAQKHSGIHSLKVGQPMSRAIRGEVLTMQISYQSVLSTWNIQHFKKSVLDVFLCIKNCEHGLMA